MRKIMKTLSMLIISSTLLAQTKSFVTYEEVSSKESGITYYDQFIIKRDNPVVRVNDKGKPINGMVIDKYKTGGVVHRGFYQDGKLTYFVNYYPNGNLERVYKQLDPKKSRVKVFYASGGVKSDVLYIHNAALKWKDYYENGQLSFYEEFNKDFSCHVLKVSYYQNGKIESKLERVKKYKFVQTEFFESGKLKSKGELRYNRFTFDYEEVGNWLYFLPDGTRTTQPLS